MSLIQYPQGIAPLVICAAQSAISFPPIKLADVSRWNASSGVVPEFDLEVWCDASCTLSSTELFAGVLHPGVIDDDNFDSVDATTNIITITGHALESGDGPIQLTNSGGALPGGLAAATDYYVIKLSTSTIQLANSRANALAGAAGTSGMAIDLTTAGSGTTTLADTAGTYRMHWHSHGFVGPQAGGTVSLTSRRAYTVRCGHRPNVVAYALVGTPSAGNISASVYPVIGGN